MKKHDLLLRKEKQNVGWKKYLIFNYINVKKCFKCWGYYHIAKNCTRNETCHKLQEIIKNDGMYRNKEKMC